MLPSPSQQIHQTKRSRENRVRTKVRRTTGRRRKMYKKICSGIELASPDRLSAENETSTAAPKRLRNNSKQHGYGQIPVPEPLDVPSIGDMAHGVLSWYTESLSQIQFSWILLEGQNHDQCEVLSEGERGQRVIPPQDSSHHHLHPLERVAPKFLKPLPNSQVLSRHLVGFPVELPSTG